MADPRFFDRLGPLTVTDIAALSGAAISDSQVGEVDDVADLASARAGAVSYLESEKFLSQLEGKPLEGVALIIPAKLAEDERLTGATLLLHDAPRAAFAKVATALFQLKQAGFDAAVASSARIASTARIAVGAVIGEGADIAEGVIIGPGAQIGPGVRIGSGTRVGANASIICSDIGENCNILAGAVIGEAGFGVAMSKDGAIDVPHLGQVILGNNVTIGANSCVDRGVFGATHLGDGVKIDNLCHIAHNVTVGPNTLMAAFAGVSGSTTIGERVMFGGRVGVADHIDIPSDVIVGGGAAVMKSLPSSGAYSGIPAQPLRDYMREVAEIRRLVRAKNKKK